MRLKGTMVLELTDVNTSEVETVTEENMITNAINNILGTNPMGIFYAATGEYDDAVLWNGTLLPICPNMIGGILLFSNTLEENADNVYQYSANLPVAYASDLPKAKQLVLFETVEVDFENNLLYSITFSNSSVLIKKVRIPIFDIGLNEKLDDSTYTVLEEQAVQTSTFLFLGSYTLYGEFFDGKDGYWYGFSNEGNSSGNAKMVWVKISKTDYSMTEGQWTLSNAKLMDVGNRDEENSYPERVVKSCMRNGYLYVPAYNKKGIYKINASNSADVTLIEFGFTSKWKPLCETGSCELYMTLVGDIIVAGDFQVMADDTIVHTQGSVRLKNAATPLFQYKHFLLGWGGSYGNEYRTMYLLTPYLASINNLSSAVFKTVDKTMKITYTLTEMEATE